ncbi:hypothetical protein [Streptomyces sp. NPDC051662]|uniref:hypothetical protein n=1 Tax=Streptomyces sp. NPDC051662 TaxID=3154750 RepID=UPI003415C611
MNLRRRATAVAAAVAAVLAVSAVAAGANATAATVTAATGWSHVEDFADLGACQARGRWYLANGGNVQRDECRAAGVWQLWVLTSSS